MEEENDRDNVFGGRPYLFEPVAKAIAFSLDRTKNQIRKIRDAPACRLNNKK